eukprot:CAMPEP_0172479642 /NCGR_PEP_ID=MMETSP1066-20121228/4386_1 /TAXON_ID=671091 /ORGANISM="Coscinodiscus wailesii, Strain CCMP2513" /LENGTH=152 /DNA_ID=CAMNT_0013240311 /DNA_START=195 /DNA_END=650 /DNA_ORIENTATION=-
MTFTHGRIADRSRIVRHRMDKGVYNRYRDNGRPIEGQSYRTFKADDWKEEENRRIASKSDNNQRNKKPWDISTGSGSTADDTDRVLSSQLTGCCYSYQSYSANSMCSAYGNDCESGETPSHDSGDDDCSLEGLSFIGISFSVNTANGNPYSY